MLGLLGIGLALVPGIGMRVAAGGAVVQLVLLWLTEWPLDRYTSPGAPSMPTNPIIDYHLIYAAVAVTLAVPVAGNVWGYGVA